MMNIQRSAKRDNPQLRFDCVSPDEQHGNMCTKPDLLPWLFGSFCDRIA